MKAGLAGCAPALGHHLPPQSRYPLRVLLLAACAAAELAHILHFFLKACRACVLPPCHEPCPPACLISTLTGMPCLCRYDKVIDIPNSMTVLPELLPLSIEMAKRKLTGIMNYTNPGAISHNEILQVGSRGSKAESHSTGNEIVTAWTHTAGCIMTSTWGKAWVQWAGTLQRHPQAASTAR